MISDEDLAILIQSVSRRIPEDEQYAPNVEYDNYGNVTSDGLEALVRDIAEEELAYLNGRIANRYPEQSSPLPDSVMQLLKKLTVVKFLYYAYRRMEKSDTTIANTLKHEVELYLDRILSGKAILVGVDQHSKATPVLQGEDRQFYLHTQDDGTPGLNWIITAR